MSQTTLHEDVHFYLDNANPDEVTRVLRVLSMDTWLSTTEISTMLADYYGYEMQKDKTLSPRRLYDIGLTAQKRVCGSLKYALNPLGAKVQTILGSDPALALDLLHFLHYSGFHGNPWERKLLWSYRRCCDLTWKEGVAIPTSALASVIQTDMKQQFPHLSFGADKGVRFNASAAGNVYAWLRALDPSPIPPKGGPVAKRDRPVMCLVLLGVDLVYRSKGFSYGDPVLMDSRLIDEVAAVFLMSPECCSATLRSAVKSSFLDIVDTLNGPVIRLPKSYGVGDI